MTRAGSGELKVSGGGRTASAWWRWAGADLVVVVGGGTRPHVGSIVLALPRPSRADPARRSVTCSVLNVPPHKDEAVARDIARKVATQLGCRAVVTAGIHEDGLGPDGVDGYLKLAQRLGDELVRALNEE